MVLKKYELEATLHAEKREISNGRLKDENPLDVSKGFQEMCGACRRGDLKRCQELITDGVNINARDEYDYSPLILASLCGHYEVVQLLLESGALCERDTFQGERCLYNALNDRIRNLLLKYDYSKSTDPLQPLASHITSLLIRTHPKTSDITLSTSGGALNLHKFILSARSPYFRNKLASTPESNGWKLSSAIPPLAFDIVIRYLYLGEIPLDLSGICESDEEEKTLVAGIDKLSKQLGLETLLDNILGGGDRRLARQRRTEEVTRGRDQLEEWFREHVLKHKVVTNTRNADDVRWDRDNAIFADVLLRADADVDTDEEELDGNIESVGPEQKVRTTDGPLNGIPVGPVRDPSPPPEHHSYPRTSTLFPVHRAMLLRSDFFSAMFSSTFREAQDTSHLQIIPIDCSPEVLEIVLYFIYTEKAEFPLDLAIDVLFAADQLFLEKLKVKAATVISTLGNGTMTVVESDNPRGMSNETEPEIDIYDVIRAGWLTRVHRLEEFAARYLAYRLEYYIDEEEFAELIRESAARIKARQETDSIELLDDIRYYLSERFRLRFEDSGIDEMIDATAGDESDLVAAQNPDFKLPDDEGVDLKGPDDTSQEPKKPDLTSEGANAFDFSGVLRTLDGQVTGDEFSTDAQNYRILLGKIDTLLERLKLDA
ncbi:hypothetical protein L228DRAFT_249679 [Xylona heveae TC161]|uniref:BTB domain-containing protein n=1 Tax=Xylona heveae (strain CBS 132557 / TC161) TaxID=1328760 RepID=A0A165FDX3_XYLHT|nr:hypothetical protein L228DRAFT_249679 [Xylona heveae TC161]KZF20866.1 hypothetical protein L228DRAFT_249679 [Xylona heveae TC161]